MAHDPSGRYAPACPGTETVPRLREPEGAAPVPERVIQLVWRDGLFDAAGLRTTADAPLVVLDPGTLNGDQGPDFLAARLRIGGVEWIGDVEVHRSSGQWIEHGHHGDPRYDRVVLHVTLLPDLWTGKLRRADGALLPEVVLLPRLDRPIHRFLGLLAAPPAGLFCEAQWTRVPEPVRDEWVRLQGRLRVQERVEAMRARVHAGAPLDAVLYESLLAALGYAKNGAPMAELAARVPLALARRLSQPLDLEALYFGVAGLIPRPADLLAAPRETADYAMELSFRFERLRCRFDLAPMEGSAWRFFRLRPSNFPTLRIAQAAALLREGGLLHRDPLPRLREALPAGPDALRDRLAPEPGDFWERHYRLDRPAGPHPASIGRERGEALLVNAVLPALLADAAASGDDALAGAALDAFERIAGARDEVTARFEAAGRTPGDALEAQGLHRLYRRLCSTSGCLECRIGRNLLGLE